MRLKRRAFLQALSTLAAGCAAESASSESDIAAISGGGKDVVVLGGGLSGMCTAFELQKRGYRIVAILEAQDRTGGRVFTARDPFVDGQYAECGATRIADTHNFTLAYAQQFDLPLREFQSGDGLYYLKGRAPFVHKDGDAWPDFLELVDADRKKGADDLVLGYEKLDELGDPRRADWPTGKALDYDKMGIIEYLRANGATNDAVLIDKAINGSELDADAALYWLMADVVDKAWDKTFAIKGGNDQLPGAFAARLADVIQKGCKVVALAQDDKSVTVTFEQKGARRSVSAALAVCALPFSVLRRVDLGGARLSADKSQLIRTMRYMPVSRCAVQTKTRFWREKGIGGLKVARTDTAIERLWDLSNVQDGERGMITAYMQNQNGLAFAKAPTLETYKQLVRKFFPEIDEQAERHFVKIWQDDPFVGGAWAYYEKGEARAMPLAKARQGRVFFCGEHTSCWSGWMQGALESANRVVAEITNGA